MHISQALKPIVEQQELTHYSSRQKLNSALSKEEQKVLEVKYASKPFGRMSEDEVLVAANAMLLKIHIVTGWVIPEAEFLTILKDQFIKKMQESYSNVNTDEIEYAFRTFGTTVKDWGKSLNLSLIDEVMIPYLEQRATVSRIEEQKKLPALEMKEDLSERTMSDWYEETARQIKANKLPLDLIPQMLADWLIKKGTIEYTLYYPHAVERIKNQLIANATDRQVRKDYNEFREMYNSGEFSGVWIEKIERLAKAMSVNDYVLKQTV
jgi:hypothetical protein